MYWKPFGSVVRLYLIEKFPFCIPFGKKKNWFSSVFSLHFSIPYVTSINTLNYDIMVDIVRAQIPCGIHCAPTLSYLILVKRLYYLLLLIWLNLSFTRKMKLFIIIWMVRSQNNFYFVPIPDIVLSILKNREFWLASLAVLI